MRFILWKNNVTILIFCLLVNFWCFLHFRSEHRAELSPATSAKIVRRSQFGPSATSYEFDMLQILLQSKSITNVSMWLTLLLRNGKPPQNFYQCLLATWLDHLAAWLHQSWQVQIITALIIVHLKKYLKEGGRGSTTFTYLFPIHGFKIYTMVPKYSYTLRYTWDTK